MKLKNVYTGFTKDGIERIFIKGINESEIPSYTYYYDIQSKRIFKVNEILQETLRPFKDIYSDSKRLRKKKIIESYKLDRNELFDMSKYFIANIYKVTHLSEELLDDYKKDYLNEYKDMKGIELLESDVVVNLDENKPFGLSYINVLNGKEYANDNNTLEKGEIFASDLRPLSNSDYKEENVKKKVLKYAYEKKFGE